MDESSTQETPVWVHILRAVALILGLGVSLIICSTLTQPIWSPLYYRLAPIPTLGSPNGSVSSGRLLFAASEDYSDFDIFIFDSRTDLVTQLTDDPAEDRHP